MESWLRQRLGASRYPWLRAVFLFVTVLLALAKVVDLASGMGLASEIAQNRVGIWACLISVAAIVAAGEPLLERYRELTALRVRVRELEHEVEEANSDHRSLLRLMERYKTAAYSEVLGYLERVAIVAAMRESWKQAGAKVCTVRVGLYSGAESLDAAFAVLDRIEVRINIGSDAGVAKGMEFEVSDPNVLTFYGLVTVKELHARGALCSLSENIDPAFWGAVIEQSQKGIPGVIEVANNVISPRLPPGLDRMTPDLARELRTWVHKIESAEAGANGGGV